MSNSIISSELGRNTDLSSSNSFPLETKGPFLFGDLPVEMQVKIISHLTKEVFHQMEKIGIYLNEKNEFRKQITANNDTIAVYKHFYSIPEFRTIISLMFASRSMLELVMKTSYVTHPKISNAKRVTNIYFLFTDYIFNVLNSNTSKEIKDRYIEIIKSQSKVTLDMKLPLCLLANNYFASYYLLFNKIELNNKLTWEANKATGMNLPIRWACWHGHTDVVKFLLSSPQKGPPFVNLRTFNYETLISASSNGHKDVVELILSHHSMKFACYLSAANEALCKAATNGHVDIVKLLLSSNLADPSDNDCEAIVLAYENNHFDVVKLLIAHHEVNPNFLMHWAAKNNHTDLIKLLFSHPRIKPGKMILWGFEQDYVDLTKLFLYHPSIDNHSIYKFAIKWVAKNGHPAVMNLLLTP